MTQSAPSSEIFTKLALFNWVVAKLRDAIQPSMTILHSRDGSDLSAFSLTVNADLIAVHRIDPKSENPQIAFFAAFAKSLARPTCAHQNLLISADPTQIGDIQALHIFADRDFIPARPLLRGTRVQAPALLGDRPQFSGDAAMILLGEAASPFAPGFLPIRIGDESLCAVAGLEEEALGRLRNLAGVIEGEDDLLEFAKPDLPPRKTLAIPAERIVHDGGYLAETDGNYSWLWTGPDPYFRLMIGKIPFRPARLSLIVAGEGAPGNLEKARMFVNGELRESRAEKWDGGGGRLSVVLDESCADPVVLCVAAPSMPAVNGRKLGLSIAQLEIGEAQ